MGDTIAKHGFRMVSVKHSNDSLLARGNTLRSDEDRLELDELMALCTTLQNRVLDLEKTKTSQDNGIASLKRRAKKLEKKNRSRTHKLNRLYKVGLTARENDEVNVVKEVVEVISAAGNVVSTAGAATTVSAATTTTDDDGDITLAQALIEIKSTKPKNKRVVIQELGESTTIISSQLSSQQSQDKGKGTLIELVKPMKMKDQIRCDEELL
ncbi:hypothetical protein Tco_1192819 [Tanacetum coccineum]